MILIEEQQLCKACRRGNVKEVEQLLQNELIDPNWQGCDDLPTPFHVACEEGHIEIVKILLKELISIKYIVIMEKHLFLLLVVEDILILLNYY